MRKPHVICIGAGPAGLTASYLLTKQGYPVTVLEADPEYVGGISRTARYKGFLFDIGGHRFFSKATEVEDLWTELLGPDMIERPRSSRIYYRRMFFNYPLKAQEALFKLGVMESILCVLSYVKARLFPVRNPTNLKDWVCNRFGYRLFSIFFRTYTEKVWGMKCEEISADWAAQRITGLSLSKAILNALFPPREKSSKTIKTLIHSFRYPRKGPGMMWEAAAAKTQAQGGSVVMGAEVEGLERSEDLWRVKYRLQDGSVKEVEGAHVISTMPMNALMSSMKPAPKSRAAAQRLKYRDFFIVSLMLKDKGQLTDNWIYIHDPNVKVGRIQNFKSWSPELIPDPSMACLGLEYFCFENDDLWSKSDVELIQLAKSELAYLGLAEESEVLDGCVVRQKKAYPVYDDEYTANVEEIKKDIEEHYPNLHLVGRNGMHKYNNQDHAMMTAMLAVKNIVAEKNLYDVWRVNQEAEYHETDLSKNDHGGRLVPKKVSSAPSRAAGPSQPSEKRPESSL